MPRTPVLTVLASLLFGLPLPAQGPADETEILFLKIPTVQGASRFDQTASEAPASVTVISADEIARQGWRTLGEVLNSVRGFFTTYDRAYTYLATRGFGRPGDYSNRVLLLLDGRSLNDPIYGGGAYGTESGVEVRDIDRVEVIRGPGSSLYGASAFFGVVNVITKRGRDLDGARLETAAASYGTASARGAFGRRFASGLEVLASGYFYRQAGQRLYFPEFDDPATHDGIADFDRDRRGHFLLKASWSELTLEAVYNDRRKEVPTGSFGTIFDDARSAVRDEQGFLALSWTHNGADGRKATASLAANHYAYQGSFPQEDGLYADRSRGQWASADFSIVRPLGRRQKLIAGAEYRLEVIQEQSSWLDGDPASLWSNDTPTDIWAAFVQDEIRVGRLLVNAGLRFDHYQTFGGTLSPRATAVYGWRSGAAKLLYGRAFRAPSNYELFYSDGYSVKAAPSLDPEHIATVEAVLEQRLSRHLRGVLSLYQYRAHALINQVLDPTDDLLVYRNAEAVKGRGIEGELEFEFPRLQGRVSYAFQRSEYTDTRSELTNSPRHLVQAAVSHALVPGRVTAGFSLVAMSARGSAGGAVAPRYALGNLTLRARRIAAGLGGTFGVYNLWNTRYGDPVGEEHVQRTLRQDGRQVRVGLALEF